jgi:O6-methylguanine-DNA--protein-cysteine methyltransferase
MAWTMFESPLGPLTLVGGEAGLRELHFPERRPDLAPADRDPDALRDACRELEQYFAGERQAFEIELDLSGTGFRRRVWRALQALPLSRRPVAQADAPELRGRTRHATGAVGPRRAARAVLAVERSP